MEWADAWFIGCSFILGACAYFIAKRSVDNLEINKRIDRAEIQKYLSKNGRLPELLKLEESADKNEMVYVEIPAGYLPST